MQLKDLPVPPQEVPAWAEYLYPAGFAEGLGVPLSTRDGRYLGQFGANTADVAPLPDATIAVLARLAPLIAHALDPLRSLTALAETVHHAMAGVILIRSGDAVPLPGLRGHPLLVTGSPALVATSALLGSGRNYAAFLCPVGGEHTTFLKVIAMVCEPQLPEYPSTAVLLSPPPDLHHLTHRELEVLGLMIEGWSNAHIAAALLVTPRTIAAHVEHVMVKLNASSRTMAAVHAEQEGLYLPRFLTRSLGSAA
jgi:DNA-binding CsgD family transcriptional regulator